MFFRKLCALVLILRLAAAGWEIKPSNDTVAPQTLRDIYIFAAYSHAAYCDTNTDGKPGNALCVSRACTHLTRQATTSHEFIRGGGSVVGNVVVTPGGGHAIVVTFRGTESVQEMLRSINASLVAVPHVCEGCAVHAGFYEAYNSVQEELWGVLNETMERQVDARIKAMEPWSAPKPSRVAARSFALFPDEAAVSSDDAALSPDEAALSSDEAALSFDRAALSADDAAPSFDKVALSPDEAADGVTPSDDATGNAPPPLAKRGLIPTWRMPKPPTYKLKNRPKSHPDLDMLPAHELRAPRGPYILAVKAEHKARLKRQKAWRKTLRRNPSARRFPYFKPDSHTVFHDHHEPRPVFPFEIPPERTEDDPPPQPLAYARLVLVGHSYGAAVATIAAAHLRARGQPVDLFTYGSPRVGNAAFAAFLSEGRAPNPVPLGHELERSVTARVTNRRDFVVTQPPVDAPFGFAHTWPEYWFSEGVARPAFPFNLVVCAGALDGACSAQWPRLDLSNTEDTLVRLNHHFVTSYSNDSATCLHRRPRRSLPVGVGESTKEMKGSTKTNKDSDKKHSSDKKKQDSYKQKHDSENKRVSDKKHDSDKKKQDSYKQKPVEDQRHDSDKKKQAIKGTKASTKEPTRPIQKSKETTPKTAPSPETTDPNDNAQCTRRDKSCNKKKHRRVGKAANVVGWMRQRLHEFHNWMKGVSSGLLGGSSQARSNCSNCIKAM